MKYTLNSFESSLYSEDSSLKLLRPDTFSDLTWKNALKIYLYITLILMATLTHLKSSLLYSKGCFVYCSSMKYGSKGPLPAIPQGKAFKNLSYAFLTATPKLPFWTGTA
ncbi:hypothetical protein ACFFRR_006442 [Megaselia abdita]